MLSSGANVILVSSGANVIIWCYHVMLSSGMITHPFFIFPENCTHSRLTTEVRSFCRRKGVAFADQKQSDSCKGRVTAQKVGQTDSRRNECLQEKGQSDSCKGRVTAQKVRWTTEGHSFCREKGKVTAVRNDRQPKRSGRKDRVTSVKKE
jgi:hypothetical protein